jgi:hypothetical protein
MWPWSHWEARNTWNKGEGSGARSEHLEYPFYGLTAPEIEPKSFAFNLYARQRSQRRRRRPSGENRFVIRFERWGRRRHQAESALAQSLAIEG